MKLEINGNDSQVLTTDITTTSADNESAPTLEESMEECKHLIELCIKNQYNEAIDLCDKWSRTSLYHSHGKSLLTFMKAVLTLEPPELAQASHACNQTNDLCQKYRKSQSISNSVSKYLWKHDYNEYTDEELHAELIHAENLMLLTFLAFFSDQNLMTIIKGAFRIRTGHAIYKECQEIADHRTEWMSESSKTHFRSGVLLGTGAMSLVLSHLPKRVIKLLEVIGFSGNRINGMDSLYKCSSDLSGLRSFPSQLLVNAYECYVNQMFSDRKSNLEIVEQFVERGLNQYAQSAWFLWFRARVLQLKGNIDVAIIYYNKCIEAQEELKQLHNICYWELLWCHAIKFEWDVAANYAQILKDGCNWSAATFLYIKATFLYMKMIDENKPEMREEVSEMFREVPELRVRIAGKTTPPEKYCVVNAVKYFNQNESLVLPAFEMFYFWNVFSLLYENPKLIEPMILRINKMIPKYITDTNDSSNAIENYLLLLLLRGVCLKVQKDSKSAEKCFTEILKNEKHIKKDKYILPMTSLELGLTKMDLKLYSEAKQWLRKAKNDYSGYLLEIVLHFRVHSALQRIKLLETNKS